MTQQRIRFVIPSSSQGGNRLNIINPTINHQNTSSPRLLNRISTSSLTPTRIILTKSPSTFTLYSNPKTIQIDNSRTAGPPLVTFMKSSSTGIPTTQLSSLQVIPDGKPLPSNGLPTKPPENMKRSLSCPSISKKNAKRLRRTTKFEETDAKSVKRRNWSDGETHTFIQIWSVYYPKLISGGSRNSPIYHSMAIELNSLLFDRVLSGGDVKSKIGNLTAEYRRRKKEQGSTGGTPSTWPYFDSIDKIIGERPYNDDSLLSDSITIEQEEFPENTDRGTSPEFNLTQVSKQVNDDIVLMTNNNLRNSPTHIIPVVTTTTTLTNSVRSPETDRIATVTSPLLGYTNPIVSTTPVHIDPVVSSRSDLICTNASPIHAHADQVTTPNHMTRNSAVRSTNSEVGASQVKKNIPARKKRASETKLELLKEFFGKIEVANDIASRSEAKVLELLEKQTTLQEEIVNNEREFLNLFKNIVQNVTNNP